MVGADLHPQVLVVLTDTAGESDGIHTAHSGSVGADELLDLVNQHIEGQLSSLVAFAGCGDQIAAVAGDAGKRPGSRTSCSSGRTSHRG